MSTDTVLILRLEEEVYGLSIVEKGSWLIEDVANDRSMALHPRTNKDSLFKGLPGCLSTS